MLQTERIIDYRQSRFPQAAELEVENVFRIPDGTSRETRLFGAPWREASGFSSSL